MASVYPTPLRGVGSPGIPGIRLPRQLSKKYFLFFFPQKHENIYIVNWHWNKFPGVAGNLFQ